MKKCEIIIPPHLVDFVNVVLRVLCHGQRFYSRAYKRMKKKVCFVVLFQHEQYKMGEIEYFVLNKITNTTVAVITPLASSACSVDTDISDGNHICPV